MNSFLWAFHVFIIVCFIGIPNQPCRAVRPAGRKDMVLFPIRTPQLDTVYQYILNQEEHRRKKTFREEYIDFLQNFEIEHDEKYLFEWIE